MHHAKNRGNKEIPLSRILAQSCVTLCLNYVAREGLHMIVLVSVSSAECYFEFFKGLHPNNSSVDHEACTKIVLYTYSHA